MTVQVIDSVMGSGKTQGMIAFMRDNPGRKYLYISPFRSEVGDGNTGTKGRLQNSLPDLFPPSSMPKNCGDGKVEGLKNLLSRGVNVATTHALFCRFDDEVTNMVLDQGYVIIIDEAVDCIEVKGNLTENEVQALVNSQWINVDSQGLVTWNEEKNPDYSGRYNDVKTLAKTDGLRLFDKRYLVVEYPPRILVECEEVYVMTYLFEGSMMSCWMKVNQIEYEYMDIAVLGIRPPKSIKVDIRSNIEVLGSRKLDNKYTTPDHDKFRYSSTWYKKNSSVADKIEVRKAMESCVSNHKASGSNVFWTSFKDQKDRLEGKGYKKGFVDRCTGEAFESFLPFNTKAINDYQHHDLVMYTVNLFKPPIVVRYLKSRGVIFDDDLWALSEMLQFIWRARIRQGLPTKVLIISKRMRKLLVNWLEEDT